MYNFTDQRGRFVRRWFTRDNKTVGNRPSYPFGGPTLGENIRKRYFRHYPNVISRIPDEFGPETALGLRAEFIIGPVRRIRRVR